MSRPVDAPTFYVMVYAQGKKTWRALHSLSDEQFRLMEEAMAGERKRRTVLTQAVKRIWTEVPTGLL